MMPYGTAGDSGPLTWWGRVPVYATTWLVIAHCAAMVLVAFSGVFGYSALIGQLAFSSTDVIEHGKLWQIVTYAFVSMPSLWFLVEMAMLYFFGQEVEKALGRRVFLTLYGILILLPPLFLTAAGLFGTSTVFAGAGSAHFAIFVAFVLLHPDMPIFFGIPAKWLAVALLALYSLMAISGMNWTAFSMLWLQSLASYMVLRQAGVSGLPGSKWIEQAARSRPPTPEPRRKPVKRAKARTVDTVEIDPLASIDPILEKIARSGLDSLTSAERERLERARAALMHKENKP